MNKKVVVAMSGGVDSSVTAALLMRNGYEVSGMILKLWTKLSQNVDETRRFQESCQLAENVASHLGIPFSIVDAEEEFKKLVVDPFIYAYMQAKTPNPCYCCNQTIKWGLLLKKALDTGADFLATGHFANTATDEKGIVHLLKARDEKKDQSYILSGLNQDQLKHALFPIGNYTKVEIRQLASDFGLSVADQEDSQDLCFVGNMGYRQFLIKQTTGMNSPGLIRTIDGVVVGQHHGLCNFTIGQRKGLGSGLSVPHFVLRLDVESNEVIIGTQDQLGSDLVRIGSVNWIQGKPADEKNIYDVKIRYKAKAITGRIRIEPESKAMIQLDKPVRDATPGQIAVIYQGEEVVGSGMILSTERGKR